MQLHVNTVEASEIPKTDFLSASDHYLLLQVSSLSSVQRTKCIEGTQNPIFNQEFHFNVTNPEKDILIAILKNRNPVSEDMVIASVEIPLNSLQIGTIIDKWYKMSPMVGVKNGCHLRIALQLAPSGHPAFQPYNMHNMNMYSNPYPMPNFSKPNNPYPSPNFNRK